MDKKTSFSVFSFTCRDLQSLQSYWNFKWLASCTWYEFTTIFFNQTKTETTKFEIFYRLDSWQIDKFWQFPHCFLVNALWIRHAKFPIYRWSFILKFHLEVSSWSFILKFYLKVSSWSFVLKFHLEVSSWSFILKFYLEVSSWSFILKFHLEVSSWSFILKFHLKVSSWSFILNFYLEVSSWSFILKVYLEVLSLSFIYKRFQLKRQNVK